MGFCCDLCDKTFKQKYVLNRHVKQVHSRIKEVCTICCDEHFNLSRHIKEAHGTNQRYTCGTCGTSFLRQEFLNRHRIHKYPTNSRHEPLASATNTPMDTYPIFQAKAPTASGHKRKTDSLWRPWEDKKPKLSLPCQDPPCNPGISGSITSPISELVQDHWKDIRTHYNITGKIQDTYNFRLDDVSPQNTIVESALKTTIHLQVRDALQSEDLLEYCRIQRPNSKHIVVGITNLLVYITKLKPFPISCPIELPDVIKNNPAIIGLDRDRHHGRRYTDNYCFFRCLALHGQPENVRSLETPTKDLVKVWCQKKGITANNIEGVTFDDLPELEKLFKINIEVYSITKTSEILDSDDGDINEILVAEHERMEAELNDTPVPRKIFRSTFTQPGAPMYLNFCINHFSYIPDIRKYCKTWKCSHCSKLFPHHGSWNRHQKKCNGGTSLKYPGGGYGLPKTIFEELNEEGFIVNQGDQFYPYRASFDYENYFESIPNPRSGKLQFTHTLIPASVSIASNVPGYESPKCFISNGDPLDLVVQMYDYLSTISAEAHRRLQRKFSDIIEDLSQKVIQMDQLLRQARRIKRGQPRKAEELENQAKLLEKYVFMQKKFDRWLRQLVVLGFNSCRFDCNLIRKYLTQHMVANRIPVLYIIKKGNAYMSISLEDMQFLDVTNYLAAGTSYSKWLKGFDVSEQKGWWPYEWFTSLDLLQQTSPPSKASFYSTLKQKGISDEEYSQFLDIWQNKAFATMKDLLIWYNNLDVGPFLQTTEKMFDHWKTLGIDMFKGGGISLPGLAMIHMFRSIPPHTFFTLWNEKNKSYHKLIRDNIIGGPAIIFTRYHEVDQTRIRGTKLTKKSSDTTPTACTYGDNSGEEVRRVAVPDPPSDPCSSRTLAEYQDRLKNIRNDWDNAVNRNMKIKYKREPGYTLRKSELEWIEWMGERFGVKVQHFFNGNQKVFRKSKRIKYPVDGFIPEMGVVLQFHGCKWYGHGCLKDPDRGNQSSQERYQKTKEITRFIESQGYRVVEKWECDWMKERKNSQIAVFLESNFQTLIRATWLTANNILQAVKNGLFFGMVECDIEVSKWDMESEEKFKDLPPIFKNVEISVDDIGEYMGTFARERKLLPRPRKSLITSYFGKKVLLATPLLAWYRSTIFGEEVAQNRRQADLNPTHKIKAEMFKTTGNSYYGKTMTDVTKHFNIKLLSDAEIQRAVNDPLFRKMESINDNAYEVEMAKKTINFNLPTNIAYFVYSYAKLRMLEFVYDFLNKFIDKSDFQLISMDTDSIYAAYSSDNFDDLIRPHLRTDYFAGAKSHLLATTRYDERTPGLFKVEWQGDGMIALCAKTYYTWENDNQTNKLSSKELSKITNNFSRADFMSVLETRISGSGINHGFVRRGPDFYKYVQERSALSYLYIKRKILSDGVNTVPLDL